MFLFSVPPSDPGSQLFQGPLLFCPPATPSNCQGIDDELRIFRPSSARSGPHPPVATSAWKHKPLISIEKHFVLSPDRYAVVQLSHFLTTMPCAVPLPSWRHTRPRTESREVTRKDDVRPSISNALTGRTNMVNVTHH